MHDSKIVKRERWAGVVLTLVVLLTASIGCSQPQQKTVNGKVTYRGKPVFPGTVVLAGDGVKMLRVNLTAEGTFVASGVEMKSYSIAIQTQKLGQMASVPKPKDPKAKSNGDGEEDDQPRREDTRPPKFKGANVAIPDRYSQLSTTPLSVDFSQFDFGSTLELNLDEN